MVVSCTKNQGPVSFEYLKADKEINADLAAEISRIPKPREPQLPIPSPRSTPQARQEFVRRQQEYSRELTIYLPQVATRLRQISAAVERAQKKLGELSAAGVDPIAVRLVVSHEAILGDARLAFLEAAEFVRLNQQFLVRTQNPDLLGLLMAIAEPAIHGYISGGPMAGIGGGLDGILQLEAKASEFRQHLDGQFAKYHAAALNVNRDEIEIRTSHEQAATLLSRKYPRFDWSFVGR